jgi:UDP-N-acetylglucosamine acyltransferase
MPIGIAKSARVDPRSVLGEETEVGPGCLIGPGVQVGRGTRLIGHVCLLGNVRIGENNTIHPFVAIGGTPQDISYRGEPTRVEIGDGNRIGGRVTIHRGTEKDGGVTRIGDNNHLADGVHIAHDCRIGHRNSIGVDSMLAGHVHLASDVTVGEKVGIHQWVTVGGDSHIGGHTKITRDVPCYMRVEGNPPVIRSINGRALKLRGATGTSLASLREAHRLLFVVRMRLEDAATILDDLDLLTDEVLLLVKFLEEQQAGKLGRARVPRSPLPTPGD